LVAKEYEKEEKLNSVVMKRDNSKP